MKITLRQLRYFAALAQERHFGRAAARAGVSQPALSAQVRELEAALGGPVIERAQPGLPLTPLGREVAARAGAVLAEVRALEGLAGSGRGLALPLTLGLIPTVAPYLVPPLLPLVRAAGGRLTVREAVTETLLAELRQGVLDAAVIALPAPAGDLVAEPLFDDRFLLALPPEAVAPGALPVPRPEQLDGESLLLLDEAHCLSTQALGACGLRREGGRMRFGAASLATLARLVASGQGVTLIPELAAEADGRGLRLSRFAAPEPGRTIGLVRPGGVRAPDWFAGLAGLLRQAGAQVPRPAL